MMYEYISDSVIRLCKKNIEEFKFKADYGIENYDVNYEKIELMQSVINNIKMNEKSFITLEVNIDLAKAVLKLHSKGLSRRDIVTMYYNNDRELDEVRLLSHGYREDWIIDYLGGMYRFEDEDKILN